MTLSRPRLMKLVLITLAVTLAMGAASWSVADAQVPSPGTLGPRPGTDRATNYIPSCPGPVAKGFARCHARVRIDTNTGTPSGYGPSDLQSAYSLGYSFGTSVTWSSAPVVALVDAYDDPNAESDLGVYRKQYGLPACTTSNGCFSKVNQTGGRSYPRRDGSWSQEISVDLDMASAICPTCRILLVEANSNSFNDLGRAVNEAVYYALNTLKAPGIAASNSYGASEASLGAGEGGWEQFYSPTTSYNSVTAGTGKLTLYPNTVITVSSGDGGYGVEYPAVSHDVVAVGGTSLCRTSGSGCTPQTNRSSWAETAWGGAGSGCSQYIDKPSWQVAQYTHCPNNKMVTDVSATADPNNGVAVYDTVAYFGLSGWLVFGGTSVASPIVAATYAHAGISGECESTTCPASLPWKQLNPTTGAIGSDLWDVTSGSNGTCNTSTWCTAAAGYDGPTGLGSPHTNQAF